ncbi:H2-K region expressed gene 6, isoform CRA_c, partial [Mus musculus]
HHWKGGEYRTNELCVVQSRSDWAHPDCGPGAWTVGQTGDLAKGRRVSVLPGVSIHSSSHRHGIRCNSVLPGFIATPMTQKMPEKVKDKVTAMIPLGHMGDPEDVADVVAFLASEDSGYITGASVEVSGGLFM